MVSKVCFLVAVIAALAAVCVATPQYYAGYYSPYSYYRYGYGYGYPYAYSYSSPYLYPSVGYSYLYR